MEWTKIEDELPDYDKQVLWVREDGFMFIDDIDHDNDWHHFSLMWEVDTGFDDEPLDRRKITHWMPLPKYPVYD